MTMTAQQLFQQGKLNDAMQAAAAELRNSPTNTRLRTFLFEMLCFAGEYDRAERQLDVLAQEGKQAELGALLYRSALHAERIRQQMFLKKEYPRPEPGAAARKDVSGKLNGTAFSTIEDADPRVGANFEIYAAGSYLWLPFSLISTIEMAPPKRLRDLLWAPVIVRPSETYKGRELGEVLAPVLAPASWQNADDAVRLGRATIWEENEEGQPVPLGQKMLLVDGEEVPLLEVRRLEFTSPQAIA